MGQRRTSLYVLPFSDERLPETAHGGTDRVSGRNPFTKLTENLTPTNSAKQLCPEVR